MLKLFFVLTTLVVMASVEGRSLSFKICGRQLVERLADLCRTRGGYKPLENQYQSIISNGVFGIADECCKRSCTNRDLISYCLESGEIEDDLTAEQDIPLQFNIDSVNHYNIINTPFTTNSPKSRSIIINKYDYFKPTKASRKPKFGTLPPEFSSIQFPKLFQYAPQIISNDAVIFS